MFQNIKVLSAENKITKTQKPYKALEVQDEAGASFKTNVFSDFPDFANITAGSVLKAKLEQNGQYWNLVSETQGKPRAGAFKPNQVAIKEAMDTKRTDIAHSQENKNESIKIASTMRMAVDLAIAEKEDPTVLDTLEQSIEKWRAWCWEHWDAKDSDFQPFN